MWNIGCWTNLKKNQDDTQLTPLKLVLVLSLGCPDFSCIKGGAGTYTRFYHYHLLVFWSDGPGFSFFKDWGDAHSLLFSTGSMANLPRGERAGLGILGDSIRELCPYVNPTHGASGRQGNVLWLSRVLWHKATLVHNTSFTIREHYDHGKTA